MKNINIVLCFLGAASIILLHADERCYKFGIGANKTLHHTHCHCKCDQHPSAGRGKCSKCEHFRSPKVFSPKSI